MHLIGCEDLPQTTLKITEEVFAIGYWHQMPQDCCCIKGPECTLQPCWPASSAMRASAAFVTSMMTPPFSIWARPTCTVDQPIGISFNKATYKASLYHITRLLYSTVKPETSKTDWMNMISASACAHEVTIILTSYLTYFCSVVILPMQLSVLAGLPALLVAKTRSKVVQSFHSILNSNQPHWSSSALQVQRSRGGTLTAKVPFCVSCFEPFILTPFILVHWSEVYLQPDMGTPTAQAYEVKLKYGCLKYLTCSWRVNRQPLTGIAAYANPGHAELWNLG